MLVLWEACSLLTSRLWIIPVQKLLIRRNLQSYFRYMLENGVYIAASQFEAMFISDAHTDEEIQHTLNIMHNYFEK